MISNKKITIILTKILYLKLRIISQNSILKQKISLNAEIRSDYYKKKV